MIPKIIHYCWFGGKSKPESVLSCIESWKKHCPDYIIVEWNESNYDYTKCEYMRQAFEAKKWSFVSDYARLDIIYQNGGIYLDTDVEVIRPLDSLLENIAFMGFEKTIEKKHYVASGLGFGAEKGNQLLREMMEDYYKASFYKQDGGLNLLPCPNYNTACLMRHGLINEDRDQFLEGMTVYGSDVLCPQMYCDSELQLTERTVSIHHYSSTWLDGKGRRNYERTIRLNNFFGIQCGMRISKIIEDTEYLLKAAGKRLHKYSAHIKVDVWRYRDCFRKCITGFRKR